MTQGGYLMNSATTTATAVHPNETWWFRVGGLAALAIGIAYIVIIALYASVGVPPAGSEARLDYLVGKTTAWWTIVGLSVLTNFLYVPVALSLYLALRGVNRFAILLGIAFIGLFVILENAVNWTSYGSLILLSERYASATNESQRATILAAATYVSAVLESPLAAVWAIGTLSFAFLVIGIVMLKGVFSKLTAYLGILTAVFGIAAVAGVGIAIILNAIGATIWLFLVGYPLYRLAQE
jgi:hypothetical protein